MLAEYCKTEDDTVGGNRSVQHLWNFSPTMLHVTFSNHLYSTPTPPSYPSIPTMLHATSVTHADYRRSTATLPVCISGSAMVSYMVHAHAAYLAWICMNCTLRELPNALLKTRQYPR